MVDPRKESLRASAPSSQSSNMSLRTPSAANSQVGMFPGSSVKSNYRTGSVQEQQSSNNFLQKVGGKVGGVKDKIGGAFRRSSLLHPNVEALGANTEIASLPEEFDIRRTYQIRVNHEACQLCEASFTRKAKLFNRNPERHCKRCARSICETCSETKRQLSRQDPKRVRICDFCDYEIENFRLRNSLDSLKTKVELTNRDFQSEQERFEESQMVLITGQQNAIGQLGKELTAQRSELNDLRRQQDQVEQKLKQQDEAGKAIQASMLDFEKKYNDYADANDRLRAKNDKLLAESLDLELELTKNGLLTSTQLQQIQDIKDRLAANR